MKAILKMQAGGVYVIESTAAANSVYFETDNLAKIFFRYCNYYLKDYLNVHEYCLTKDGWAMLVKIKSTKTIKKYYDQSEADRVRTLNAENTNQPKEVWRILSERVRLFISTYVRVSNKVLGRVGTLVRQKYARYECEALETAQVYMKKIRNGAMNQEQPKPKYRGMLEYCRMRGSERTNPLKSSLWLEQAMGFDRVEELVVEIFGAERQVFQGLGHLVVPKLKIEQNHPKHPPKSPPLE